MSNGVDFRKLALDLRGQLTSTESQLAALREELVTSRAAYKEQLRGVNYKRGQLRLERDDLQQRLADAERRNVELSRLLNLADHYLQDQFFNSVGEIVEPNSDDREEVRASIRAAMTEATVIDQRNVTAIGLLQMVKDNGGALEEHEWELIEAALNKPEEAKS